MGKRTLLFAFLSFVLISCKVKENFVDEERVKIEYVKTTDTLIQKEIEVRKGDTIEKHFHTLEIRTIHDIKCDTIYKNTECVVSEKQPRQSYNILFFVKIIPFAFVVLFVFYKLLKIR